MITLCFGLVIAFLIVHELDAVNRHEWRIFPLVQNLPEQLAKQIFLWAHLPITLVLLWIWSAGATSAAAMALSVFSIGHVVLHWVFRRHPRNEFVAVAGWAPILGAGAFGVVHLALVN